MIRAFLRRLLRDRVTEWWDGHDHAEQQLRDYHHRPEAERIIDGDEPHCPDCVIAWDNRADRCGLIPCDQHKPCGNCTDISPCLLHDTALWAELERRYAQ